MLNTIVVLLLVAVVAWVIWETWKNGWDVKKGISAVIAAAAAFWLWANDTITSLTAGM